MNRRVSIVECSNGEFDIFVGEDYLTTIEYIGSQIKDLQNCIIFDDLSDLLEFYGIK